MTRRSARRRPPATCARYILSEPVLYAPDIRDVRSALHGHCYAGATVLRGVRKIAVGAGEPPSIFEHDGRSIAWRPRLLVGADGRNSTIQRQLGFQTSCGQSDTPSITSHRIDCAVRRDIQHLVFPQGGGKLRLYVCYDFVGRERFTGAGRERNLLHAFRLKCMPLGKSIARGEPIGPFHSYSNEDHCVERPIAPGVVLIGDAAGHNNPETGQGLSIAMRDVRIVQEIILAGDRRLPRSSLISMNGLSACAACGSRRGWRRC